MNVSEARPRGRATLGEVMIKSNSTHPNANCSSILRLCAVLLLGLLTAPVISAQEVTDTIKIRTRVVFMDALVKDKKTGIPISDLKPENFELFDDGKLRTLSYFTREGQARK